jgi:hypothetical protein
MKVLLHVCCAPCAITPVRALRAEGAELLGYFFRDNIHPYTECRRREEALAAYAGSIALPVVFPAGYDLEGFIRKVVFRESERCRVCYHTRLLSAARLAKQSGCEAFCSTLLYSRYQDHAAIREIGEAVGRAEGIAFHYRDFRPGWREGVEESRRLGLYRQSYCGCIYSEKERYFREKAR